MRKCKTLMLVFGAIAVTAPAHAGTQTLAGAPSHGHSYQMQNGVKVYRVMSAPQKSIEHGVKVHRLMQSPVYYSGSHQSNTRSAFDDQIRIIKKKAKKQRKKAFKKGYNEGYQDGYQTALENNRYRRPIRLRQRIRTRPRIRTRRDVQ